MTQAPKSHTKSLPSTPVHAALSAFCGYFPKRQHSASAAIDCQVSPKIIYHSPNPEHASSLHVGPSRQSSFWTTLSPRTKAGFSANLEPTPDPGPLPKNKEGQGQASGKLSLPRGGEWHPAACSPLIGPRAPLPIERPLP